MSKTNKTEAFIDRITSLAKYEECTICIRDIKTGIEKNYLFTKVAFNDSIVFIYKNYSSRTTTCIIQPEHERYYAKLIFESFSQNGKYEVFVK